MRSESDLDALALDGDGPLWMQVRRALSRPILSDAWRAGHRVPCERDLMLRFGVGRGVVNQAVASLAAEGLVHRRRRAGTLVAERAPERPVFEIWDVAAEIARSGAAYRHEMIGRSRLAADDARRAWLDAPPEAEILSLECLHFQDDRPFQLEQRLIDLRAVPEAAGECFAAISPSPWLVLHVAWTQAEHVIEAAPAARDIASRLRVRPGAACLVVTRRTWNERSAVTHVRLWTEAGRQRLVGRFRPARGPAPS